MQKKSWKKWVVAILLLVLVVLASTYFSARQGIAKEVDSVKQAFLTGTDGSGYSIYTDLQTRASLAHNLRTVALRYLPAEDSRLRDLDAAANRLEGEEHPHAAYEANEALTAAADKVNDALKEATLSATDESYRIGIMTDLESYNDTISQSDYNALAREAEEKLSKFPANLLRRITFTGDIEYFE